MKVVRLDPAEAGQTFREIAPGDLFIIVGDVLGSVYHRAFPDVVYMKLDEDRWKGVTSLNAVPVHDGGSVIVEAKQRVRVLRGSFVETL